MASRTAWLSGPTPLSLSQLPPMNLGAQARALYDGGCAGDFELLEPRPTVQIGGRESYQKSARKATYLPISAKSSWLHVTRVAPTSLAERAIKVSKARSLNLPAV